MNRSPRASHEPLLNSRTLAISLLQGISVLGIILAVFIVSLHEGHGERDARALTFTTLIVANLCLILTNRSWSRTILATLRSPNAALWWVICGTVLFLGLVLYLPFLRNIFKFDRLHYFDLWLCLGAGGFSILWFEGLKLFNGFRNKRRPAP